MYNIEKRVTYRLDPVQVEQETYQNLLAMTGIDPIVAKIMDIDIDKELEELKKLAKQLTTNLIRQENGVL